MKALIPAAGLGTRLRPLTYARPKPVLRVAGVPIICRALRTLMDAGIQDVGIVVSDLTRSFIASAVEGIEGVNITYIHQSEMLGLGHAVKVARDWVADSDVCVYLGDNLFGQGISGFVQTFRERGADAVLGLVEVPDPSAFGVAVLGEDGRITALVEKPAQPPSNLAVAGVYCFSPAIFDVLETLRPSARGEYEITDAIAALIAEGRLVLGERVQGWWKDTGKPADLLDANRLLLERQPGCVLGEVHDSRLTGGVVVEFGAQVTGSVIMGPAIIGAGARIENAYIGPFTSVGRNSVVCNAEVECSVIDEDAELRNVSVRMQDCLIGVRARVIGHGTRPRIHRLTLSDASVLELGC